MTGEHIDNKTFYNLRCDKREKYSFEVGSKTEAFKFLLRKQGVDLRGKTVIDIGFGSGNILEVLKRRGAICYGVEISQLAVDMLQNEGYHLKLIEGETLPYDNECFDVIVSSHTIEHIQNEDAILQEIKRVLKPSGLFIMGVPTGKTGYNPLHFRNYSEKDIGHLSQKLHSTCVYFRTFGGPSLFYVYMFIRGIINRCLAPAKNIKNILCNNSGTARGLLRVFYQKTVARALLILYKLDMRLTDKNGIEIWYVFQKTK